MNIHDSDIRRVAFQEGEKKGAEQTKIQTAKEALKNNISLEIIAKITGLPIEKVQQLKEES
jgi:predicted transposase/invertase (TIGR01784 family)